MTTTAAPAVKTTAPLRNPRYFLISLWSIPVMVIGQFAMLAIVPVLIVLIGSVRDARLRAVRPWSIILGATYATPLVIWAIRPDGAQSLSKDMHPAFVVLISLASAVALVRTYTRKH
jgi:hypothetical protein